MPVRVVPNPRSSSFLVPPGGLALQHNLLWRQQVPHSKCGKLGGMCWGWGTETPLCATKGSDGAGGLGMKRGKVGRSYGEGRPDGETQERREGQGHRAYMGGQGCRPASQ